MADVSLTTTQKVRILAQAQDVAGADAISQFNGKISWSADNPSLVNIVNEADTLAAEAVSLGVAGSVNIVANGVDARGKEWTAQLSLEITEAAPQVASFSLVAEAPQEQ